MLPEQPIIFKIVKNTFSPISTGRRGRGGGRGGASSYIFVNNSSTEVHPAIYISCCHTRICCHGNHMIDWRISDTLHFQLERGIVLI